MYYKLKYDMDTFEKRTEDGRLYLYGGESNIGELKYTGYEQGYFKFVLYSEERELKWPIVEFYYHRPTCSAEVEFLGNVNRWPIFHNKVVEEFQKLGYQVYNFTLSI